MLHHLREKTRRVPHPDHARFENIGGFPGGFVAEAAAVTGLQVTLRVERTVVG